MIIGTYQGIERLSTTHRCLEHPDMALVAVRRPEGTYALACEGAHWMDPTNLERSENMIHDKETRLSPEDRVEITETGKTALQRKEEKEKPPEPCSLTLEGWYLRLRQFYPQAVVSTYPMPYDARSPAMLPSDLHAWVAEVFERPQGLVVARSHGYAWGGEEKEEGEPPAKPPWAWQKAEERAEIAAISRAVPLGLEPPRSDLAKEVSLE